MMKQITKEQKKIIYITLILPVFTVFLWVFIFLPQRNKLACLRNSLSETEAQITQIKQLALGRDMAEVAGELNKKLLECLDKLPSRHEAAINYLSDNAHNLGIVIKNISLHSQQAVMENIADYIIAQTPISINLTGGYKAIGEYLNILRDDSAILIRLEKIDIKREKENYIYLNADIEINVYFAKKAS